MRIAYKPVPTAINSVNQLCISISKVVKWEIQFIVRLRWILYNVDTYIPIHHWPLTLRLIIQLRKQGPYKVERNIICMSYLYRPYFYFEYLYQITWQRIFCMKFVNANGIYNELIRIQSRGSKSGRKGKAI